jgi:WD40 repeat protein
MDNIEDKPGGKREFVRIEGTSSVCFSPGDDLILATGDMDGNVQMWDSRRGTCIAKMTGHKGYVNDMQFSPDGKMLATAGEDGTTRVWDVDAKKELHVIKTRHYGVVRGVCFSPDGDLLATAGHNDDTVRLWNVNKNAYSPVKRLKGHTADVFGVRFSSARSNLLASCSADKTVILRDAATFRQTRTFRGHLDGVTCVGFSPVGDVVVSGGIDGTLRHRRNAADLGRRRHRESCDRTWRCRTARCRRRVLLSCR